MLTLAKLFQGEIKLPVLMEEENSKELPSIQLIYRPVRQMVYAILFNLHHHIYMATKQKDKGGKLMLYFNAKTATIFNHVSFYICITTHFL